MFPRNDRIKFFWSTDIFWKVEQAWRKYRLLTINSFYIEKYINKSTLSAQFGFYLQYVIEVLLLNIRWLLSHFLNFIEDYNKIVYKIYII